MIMFDDVQLQHAHSAWIITMCICNIILFDLKFDEGVEFIDECVKDYANKQNCLILTRINVIKLRMKTKQNEQVDR